MPCLQEYERKASVENKIRVPRPTYKNNLQGALPVIMESHYRSFVESSEFLTLCLDGTIDSRASKSYGIGLANQKGEFFLLNFRLLVRENGEIIRDVVKEELVSTGLFDTLRKKIKFIMSDTSATQIRGNNLLNLELGGDKKALRCVMHCVGSWLLFYYDSFK